MGFSILETSETVTATNRPIVIITSNNEKELPGRIFTAARFPLHLIPDKALMEDIVKSTTLTLRMRCTRQALMRFYTAT